MDLRQLFRIQSNTLEPQPGDLLLSEPTMNDFHFGRSVVLLVDHNDTEGTFGIIMNKPLKMKLNELVDDFSDFNAPVYWGGPVADNRIFFMHTLGDLIPESAKIMEGLYWGGDAEILNTLIEQGIADKSHVRFFLGYSGWEAHQLTGELERNSWVVCKSNAKTLINTPSDQLWKTLVDRLGNGYGMWSRFPKNPEDN